MATYGYQRVSTKGQKLARQTQQLVDYGIESANIYTDKESGGKVERAGLDSLLAVIQPGDTVVVLSFDRLARSVSHLISIAEELNSKGVELVSLKEKIDTTSPTGKFFFYLVGAFAEFEKDMNNERTRQGLAVAKKNGKVLGRPKADAGKVSEAMALYRAGTLTVAGISQLTGISQRSIYRKAKELGYEYGQDS